MTWADGPLLAFDVESTGTDVTTDRIVTAAVVAIGPLVEGQPKRKVEPHEWLLNPGIPIPAAATEVHGVTDEKAAGGMDPRIGLAEIADALTMAWSQDVPVVAMNAPFDLTMLDHELARHGLAPLEVGPVIDPLVIDRAVDKYRKGKRTLAALCEHYGVQLGDDAHTAGADALAAARVVYRQQRQWTAQLDVSLDELQELQARWQAEWAEGFEQYLRRKDPTAVIDRCWPYRAADRGGIAA